MNTAFRPLLPRTAVCTPRRRAATRRRCRRSRTSVSGRRRRTARPTARQRWRTRGARAATTAARRSSSSTRWPSAVPPPPPPRPSSRDSSSDSVGESDAESLRYSDGGVRSRVAARPAHWYRYRGRHRYTRRARSTTEKHGGTITGENTTGTTTATVITDDDNNNDNRRAARPPPVSALVPFPYHLLPHRTCSGRHNRYQHAAARHILYYTVTTFPFFADTENRTQYDCYETRRRLVTKQQKL